MSDDLYVSVPAIFGIAAELRGHVDTDAAAVSAPGDVANARLTSAVGELATFVADAPADFAERLAVAADAVMIAAALTQEVDVAAYLEIDNATVTGTTMAPPTTAPADGGATGSDPTPVTTTATPTATPPNTTTTTTTTPPTATGPTTGD